MSSDSQTCSVAIIMPVYNAAQWLPAALESILGQTVLNLSNWVKLIELSIFDDASTDESMSIIDAWSEKLKQRGIRVIIERQVF